MPASATQFAMLVTVFGKPQAFALIEYIDSQLQLTQGQVGALEAAQPPARGFGTPPRTLDTDFVVSTTRDAEVRYIVAFTIAATLLGSQTDTAQVDLLLDGVIADTTKSALMATLTLGVSLTHTYRLPLNCTVPAGSTIHLATSGTGTITLISAREILL